MSNSTEVKSLKHPKKTPYIISAMTELVMACSAPGCDAGAGNPFKTPKMAPSDALEFLRMHRDYCHPPELAKDKALQTAHKTSEEAAINISEETALKTSEEAAIKISEETAPKTSEEAALKTSEEATIKTETKCSSK